jgi:hypothetical protein
MAEQWLNIRRIEWEHRPSRLGRFLDPAAIRESVVREGAMRESEQHSLTGM